MEIYKSKVDIVYEALMEDFVKGVYKEGDRLIISQLSQKYNVSDTPVREAIRRLDAEDHIQTIANQGAIVTGYDRQKLLNIVQVKGVLEGYATRLAIDFITPKDIERLKELNKKFAIAFKENNVKQYSNVNGQFHMEIYKSIPNKDLYNIILDLWRKWVISKSLFSVILKSASLSVEEHEQILVLIEKKAYDEVEIYVRNHKFRSGMEVVNMLKDR